MNDMCGSISNYPQQMLIINQIHVISRFLTAETMDPTLEMELRERKAKRLNHSQDGAAPIFRPHLTSDIHQRAVPLRLSIKSDPQSPATAAEPESPTEKTDVHSTSSPTRTASETVKHAFCSSNLSSISGSCVGDEISHVTEVEGMRVVLEDLDLWQTFYRCGTEMIINRPGR
jgi:hypothetical protein